MSLPPSPWVVRWSHLVPAGATVLDVACGSGRHVRWFAQRGCRIAAVDRDAEAVAPLRDLAEVVVADIEAGPWPFAGRAFDAVVVTNYLWRPLLPAIVGSVADGGVLIYETFALGNEAFGRPSNPDFLLRPGELLQAVAGQGVRTTAATARGGRPGLASDPAPGLRVVAFEDGLEDDPPRVVQRICATRAGARIPRLQANATP